jgi:hypothetical protein
MFAALLIAAGANTPELSRKVADIYQRACVSGEFRLSRKDGHVVDRGRLPVIAQYLDVPYPAERSSHIRFTYPARTFLIVYHYPADTRANFRTICRVASRSLTERDATTAFVEGEDPGKIWQKLDGRQPYEPAEIDNRQAGYRKRLFFRDEWIMLETAVYK